jgi:serine/threonine protein kinase
MFGKRPY